MRPGKACPEKYNINVSDGCARSARVRTTKAPPCEAHRYHCALESKGVHIDQCR